MAKTLILLVCLGLAHSISSDVCDRIIVSDSSDPHVSRRIYEKQDGQMQDGKPVYKYTAYTGSIYLYYSQLYEGWQIGPRIASDPSSWQYVHDHAATPDRISKSSTWKIWNKGTGTYVVDMGVQVSCAGSGEEVDSPALQYSYSESLMKQVIRDEDSDKLLEETKRNPFSTCPVRCRMDVDVKHGVISSEHFRATKHKKMVVWVPRQAPGAHVNKVFHKCWRVGAHNCRCECAQWDAGDCDIGSQICPTICGQKASRLHGRRSDLGCFFRSDQLSESHCFAPDRPASKCSVPCSDTPPCPTPFPTPYPTAYPTSQPTTYPTPYPTAVGHTNTISTRWSQTQNIGEFLRISGVPLSEQAKLKTAFANIFDVTPDHVRITNDFNPTCSFPSSNPVLRAQTCTFKADIQIDIPSTDKIVDMQTLLKNQKNIEAELGEVFDSTVTLDGKSVGGDFHIHAPACYEDGGWYAECDKWSETRLSSKVIKTGCAAGPTEHRCTQCPAGKYSDPVTDQAGKMFTFCKSCPSGYHQSRAGKSFCATCEVGKFATGDGQTMCTNCPKGKYGELNDYGDDNHFHVTSKCTRCKRGLFQDREGQTDCKACDEFFTRICTDPMSDRTLSFKVYDIMTEELMESEAECQEFCRLTSNCNGWSRRETPAGVGAICSLYRRLESSLDEVMTQKLGFRAGTCRGTVQSTDDTSDGKMNQFVVTSRDHTNCKWRLSAKEHTSGESCRERKFTNCREADNKAHQLLADAANAAKKAAEAAAHAAKKAAEAAAHAAKHAAKHVKHVAKKLCFWCRRRRLVGQVEAFGKCCNDKSAAKTTKIAKQTGLYLDEAENFDKLDPTKWQELNGEIIHWDKDCVPFFDSNKKDYCDFVSTAKNAFQGIQNLANKIAKGVQNAKKAIKRAAKKIHTELDKAAKKVAMVARKAADAVTKVAKQVGDELKSFAVNALRTMTEWTTSALDFLKDKCMPVPYTCMAVKCKDAEKECGFKLELGKCGIGNIDYTFYTEETYELKKDKPTYGLVKANAESHFTAEGLVFDVSFKEKWNRLDTKVKLNAKVFFHAEVSLSQTNSSEIRRSFNLKFPKKQKGKPSLGKRLFMQKFLAGHLPILLEVYGQLELDGNVDGTMDLKGDASVAFNYELDLSDLQMDVSIPLPADRGEPTFALPGLSETIQSIVKDASDVTSKGKGVEVKFDGKADGDLLITKKAIMHLTILVNKVPFRLSPYVEVVHTLTADGSFTQKKAGLPSADRDCSASATHSATLTVAALPSLGLPKVDLPSIEFRGDELLDIFCGAANDLTTSVSTCIDSYLDKIDFIGILPDMSKLVPNIPCSIVPDFPGIVIPGFHVEMEPIGGTKKYAIGEKTKLKGKC